MPLAAYFEEQLEQLRVFLEFPGTCTRILRHDPDMQEMLLRLLAGFDRQDDNPHVMLLHTTPFHDEEQYCTALLETLQVACDLPDWPAGAALAAQTRGGRPLAGAAVRFARLAAHTAERLPRHCLGSLAHILLPDRIDDMAGFAATAAFLAKHTSSPWCKYILFDDRTNPRLATLGGRPPRVSIQTFHLSPEDIERRLSDKLSTQSMAAAEQLRYAAMLAGFHFARREFAQAAALQRTSIEAARRAEAPRDEATGWYNVGNTHLAAEEFAEAEACYGKAVDLCLSEQLDNLLAMVLTNLGVALQHQHRDEEAVASFAAARKLFRARNDRPGEGYLLEAQGQALQATGHPDDAERRWLEAIDVYEGISSDNFATLRTNSQDNVHDRLRRLYDQTGQREKLAALPEPAGGCTHA